MRNSPDCQRTEHTHAPQHEKRGYLAIPDTQPLLYLSKMNRLDLLPALYDHIQIPDAIWMELTREANERPEAERILKWGKALQQTAPRRLTITPTTLGHYIQENLKADPDFHVPQLREKAIAEWASSTANNPQIHSLRLYTLYEHRTVPHLTESLGLPIAVQNTFAFLQEAQEAGYKITLQEVFQGLGSINHYRGRNFSNPYSET